MTGFGAGDAPLGEGRIVVEVRAVNGRHLDVRARLPRELGDFTAFAEAEARKRLARGRIDIGVRAEGSILPPPALDLRRARAAFRALSDLRDELAPGAEVPLTMLASLPDLFAAPTETDIAAIHGAIGAALGRALDGLDRMRAIEGAALKSDIGRRACELRAIAARLGERIPAAVDAFARRLRDRLTGLLDRVDSREAATGGAAERAPATLGSPAEPAPGPLAPFDPARLEQEIVLFTERSDVTEELTRLESHLHQLESTLGEAGPVGRKLDFLLQEMAREINTVGAKSQDAAMAHLVVEAKSEIERMREQVQNVE